jgi:pimeloyl-ACP methyl ester carboxylesterase
MWTQSIVEQALAQHGRMLAEAAKVRSLKLAPQTQGNPLQKAVRTLKINQLRVALVLFAVLLLVGCSAKPAPVPVIPAGAHAGDLTGWTNCEFQPEGSKAKYAAECGTLVVPENRAKVGSRLIALPVVRVRASGPKPAEPVFFLNGGPGESNLTWAPPDWLLKNHDVVLVGYRGVEGTVTLTCPELKGPVNAHKGKDFFSEQTIKEAVAATKQCAARIQQEGVDLAGYTIPGVVEDVEAVRVALGYQRINLFSESYGTRIAQIYAYLHPDSLHRLVLVGVNTPGHFIWQPADFDKMLQHISDLCARDTACSKRTGNFAQTMYNVNRNMPKRWLFFNIDPATVRFATHSMFFNNPNITLVSDAYLAAGAGDPAGLALINLLVKVMPFDPIFGDQFSKAATVDREKYQGVESVRLGNSVMGAPMAELLWSMASVWPVTLIPQNLREFQETNVEMLLVNGTVDFSTPPTVLDEAKPYFHKAQMVLLPEFSHVGDVVTLQPAAFERLVTSYYDTGVADSSGFVYQPLSFKPGIGLTVMAKVMVAALVVLPALLILGVVLVIRRIRKRRTVASQTGTLTAEPSLKPQF